MQLLETHADANAASSAEDPEAAGALIDDIHLADHPVHGHLDGERDRNAGVAETAHVPAPDIPLHALEVMHLVGRADKVEELLGADSGQGDHGDGSVR